MKKNILIILFSLTTSFCFGQDFWTKIEVPENINRVHAVASNSQGWDYIATNRGVIFTKDNGETIEQTTLQHVVYHIVINEEDKIFAFYDDRMFFSDDFGDSWTERPLPFPGNLMSCLVKNNTIFCGTDYNIYKSENLGESWSTVWQTETFFFMVATLFEKSDGDLLAGMYRLIVGKEEDKNSRNYDTLPGIYRSDNGGNSWSPWALEGVNIVSIAENSQSFLYAACDNGHDQRGLYKSEDNGNTWSKCISDKYIQTVAVAPNDVLYTLKTYRETEFGPIFHITIRSFDNGTTWQPIYSHENPNYNKLFLSSNEYLYAYSKSENYLYRSSQPVSGATCSVSVTCNPAEGGEVLGAGNYLVGETATLTAKPNSGYEFVNWTSIDGDILSDSISLKLELSGDISVTANFRVISSIEEMYGETFSIYPNPFVDYINIDAGGEFLLSDYSNIVVAIHDISGKELYKGIVKDNVINLSHLSSGVYILSLNYSGNHIHKKIIKR